MTTTTTNNKSIESRYLANYIRNVQQASKGTAAQYEYRLLKFEKYVVTIASEEEEEHEQQQRNHKLVGLLQPLAKFVSDCLKRALIVRKSSRRIFTFFNELPSDDLLFPCLLHMKMPESQHFLALVRAYSDMACGACGSELRYIKGTQDGAGRISYSFYFCDRCDVEWRLRRRKE
jgi:hypothetical protein